MLALCTAITGDLTSEGRTLRTKLSKLLAKRERPKTAWADSSTDDVRAWLMRYPLLTIRAKLATLELIAGAIGEPIYLQLIALTPLYLRSGPVQKWLHRCRAQASFGSAAEKAHARRALKQVHRAIQGDLRRALIAEKMRQFRTNDEDGRLDKDRFQCFLDSHDFTDHEADLILNPDQPVVDTALEPEHLLLTASSLRDTRQRVPASP